MRSSFPTCPLLFAPPVRLLGFSSALARTPFPGWPLNVRIHQLDLLPSLILTLDSAHGPVVYSRISLNASFLQQHTIYNKNVYCPICNLQENHLLGGRFDTCVLLVMWKAERSLCVLVPLCRSSDRRRGYSIWGVCSVDRQRSVDLALGCWEQ